VLFYSTTFLEARADIYKKEKNLLIFTDLYRLLPNALYITEINEQVFFIFYFSRNLE
jgi:hypothetical protein